MTKYFQNIQKSYKNSLQEALRAIKIIHVVASGLMASIVPVIDKLFPEFFKNNSGSIGITVFFLVLFAIVIGLYWGQRSVLQAPIPDGLVKRCLVVYEPTEEDDIKYLYRRSLEYFQEGNLDFPQELALWHRNKHTFVCVNCILCPPNDRMLGYADISPVDDKAVDELRQGRIKEDNDFPVWLDENLLGYPASRKANFFYISALMIFDRIDKKNYTPGGAILQRLAVAALINGLYRMIKLHYSTEPREITCFALSYPDKDSKIYRADVHLRELGFLPETTIITSDMRLWSIKINTDDPILEEIIRRDYGLQALCDFRIALDNLS